MLTFQLRIDAIFVAAFVLDTFLITIKPTSFVPSLLGKFIQYLL